MANSSDKHVSMEDPAAAELVGREYGLGSQLFNPVRAASQQGSALLGAEDRAQHASRWLRVEFPAFAGVRLHEQCRQWFYTFGVPSKKRRPDTGRAMLYRLIG
jgi:hypothetical protein